LIILFSCIAMCFCETETRQRTIRIRRRRRIPASAEPCANGIEVKLLSQHFSGQLNFNTQNNRSVAQSDAEITDKANKVKYSTYRKGFGKYCCDYFNTLTYGIPMLPHARLHGWRLRLPARQLGYSTTSLDGESLASSAAANNLVLLIGADPGGIGAIAPLKPTKVILFPNDFRPMCLPLFCHNSIVKTTSSVVQ